jgi:hypothetical protein
MSPLGAASGGPAAIPAGDHQIPAGGGWGSGLGTTGTRFGRSVGGERAAGRGLRGTAVRCAPGARLRRALGRSSKGAARRGFRGVGRRGLGALETAEGTVARCGSGGAKCRRRAREDREEQGASRPGVGSPF